MLTSQTSSSPPQNQRQWTKWAPDHPELQRFHHSTVVFHDKILLVGGLLRGDPNADHHSKALNLVLIDPTSQKFQIIQSTGPELNTLCWAKASACYWKDSRIVVFGGWDFDASGCRSDVAIVTLKDLDSQTPSAHWERFHSTTQLFSNGHSAYIHHNRMLVLGGRIDKRRIYENPWFLDLDNNSWNEVTKPADYLTSDTTVFHNSKVYFVNKLSPNLTLVIFDFETLTWDNLIGPESPDIKAYIVCPEVIDGKIYFLLGCNYQGRWPKAEPWVFDIGSQTWTEIPASNCPVFGGEACMRLVNNQLMLCGGWVGENPIYGEFWSFPVDSPKKVSEAPLKSSENLSSTQQTMLRFLQEAPYFGISFEVESQEIKAHKWWLCKKSKYFANMFSSGMVEAQASRIKITDMTAPTFQAFLHFLYVDHVDLNNTLALDLLQQADKYSLPELAKACEKHLAENLTPDNYVVVSQMAELLDIVVLREAVINYIAKNIKQLKSRKDFEDLSDTLLRESIIKFIVK